MSNAILSVFGAAYRAALRNPQPAAALRLTSLRAACADDLAAQGVKRADASAMIDEVVDSIVNETVESRNARLAAEATVKGKTIIAHHTPGQHSVYLVQHGENRFNVIYGHEVRGGLDYSRACAALGECIMHAAQCGGLITEAD